ncbi:MAG: LLM class flavin-dependent oxidoreductase [Actinomycetota bacterium]
MSYAPWGATIEEQADAAARAEAAGFSHAWVSELHRSAFVPAAAIAARTSTIGVGTAIALAFVRSPMTTALSALDLDEMSGGRFILGIGSGVQRLNEDWHNARFGKAVPHLRETIRGIRRVVAEAREGKPIDEPGDFEPLRIRGWQRPFAQPRAEIPIYVAAVGDLMTRLAGECGDGWIGHELGSPAYLKQHLLPNIEEGIRRAGRARAGFDVVASAVCAVDDDARQAKRWAAGLVAFYATVRTYSSFFAFHGFGAQAEKIRERFKAGDEQGMADACPDEMVDALTLAGTPGDVRAKLGAYEGLADALKLSPPTHLVPDDAIRHMQRQILERLAP